MNYELIKLYFKYNNEWLYNYIERIYPNEIKKSVYSIYGLGHEKEIKKFFKKLLKNT